MSVFKPFIFTDGVQNSKHIVAAEGSTTLYNFHQKANHSPELNSLLRDLEQRCISVSCRDSQSGFSTAFRWGFDDSASRNSSLRLIDWKGLRNLGDFPFQEIDQILDCGAKPEELRELFKDACETEYKFYK